KINKDVRGCWLLRVQSEDREDQPSSERGPRVRVLLTGTEPGHQNFPHRRISGVCRSTCPRWRLYVQVAANDTGNAVSVRWQISQALLFSIGNCGDDARAIALAVQYSTLRGVILS